MSQFKNLMAGLGITVAALAVSLSGPLAVARADATTGAASRTISMSSTHREGGNYYGSASVDLRVAKLTTKRFHHLATAQAAGYTVEFKDRLGFTCISDLPTGGHQSMGAMGVHLVNPAYIGSTDPAHPAAALYQPGPHGAMKLVGLEFLVVEPQQPQAPAAFGQPFMFTPAGDTSVNRFLPTAFYSLHVWLWKHNPAGRYAMWNPTVHCPS